MPARSGASRLAADPGDLAGRYLAPLVSSGAVPSLAWAVVREGDVALGGFGGAGPRTVFQIGSVTKVFTSLLLADMAERGQLSLSDPAARHLPGGLPGGSPGGAGAVTLTDLATHTSGLPRLPRSLRWYALASPHDPYARYPAWQFVRDARRALRDAAGGSYAYSNFGYGVLGYLLGRAAGSAYEPLVRERICGPLGLADTAFGVPARLAQGNRRGRPVPPWRMGPLAAAGGLYSTAADLAALLQTCLTSSTPPPAATPVPPAAPGTPLAAAVRAALAPRREIPGGKIGLAWHHASRSNHRIIFHNGMTGGFSSMVAFDPVRCIGLAVLANTAGPTSPLDEAVFRALCPEP